MEEYTPGMKEYKIGTYRPRLDKWLLDWKGNGWQNFFDVAYGSAERAFLIIQIELEDFEGGIYK